MKMRFLGLISAIVLLVSGPLPSSGQSAVQELELAQPEANCSPSDGTAAYWTKAMNNGRQIKFYAKFPQLGEKIQFMVQQGGSSDYQELAWLRVERDRLDEQGKYLAIQNRAYFVRTLNLAPGKNRLRVLVDGQVVWGTKTYSIKPPWNSPTAATGFDVCSGSSLNPPDEDPETEAPAIVGGGGGGGGGGSPTPPPPAGESQFDLAGGFVAAVSVGNSVFVSWNEPDVDLIAATSSQIRGNFSTLANLVPARVRVFDDGSASVPVASCEAPQLRHCVIEVPPEANSSNLVVEVIGGAPQDGPPDFVSDRTKVDPLEKGKKIGHELPDSEGAACGGFGFDSTQISPDGRFVAFRSDYENLVQGDSNCKEDVFILNLFTGAISLISTNQQGVQGNADVRGNPAWSPNGRWLTFDSEATNLVPNTANGYNHLYAKNIVSGQLILVDRDAGGQVANNETCGSDGYWSSDSRQIGFTSKASNLVPGDNNGACDVFIKNLLTGAIIRVSTKTDGSEIPADSYIPRYGEFRSRSEFWSASDRFVSFSTNHRVLEADPNNNRYDIYVKDLTTGALTLSSEFTGVSQKASEEGFQKSWSNFGNRILFELYDGEGDPRTSRLLIRDYDTNQVQAPTSSNCANRGATFAKWAPDDSHIYFLEKEDGVAGWNVCVWDLSTNAITKVATAANQIDGAFSPDGKRLAYMGPDNKVFIYDLELGRDYFSGMDGVFNEISWSSDGSRLVSADPNGILIKVLGDVPPP